MGLSIAYSPEKTALETAGGIANALHLLGANPFLVVNGDVYTDLDFAQFKLTPMQNKLVHMALVDNPPQHQKGDFAFADNKLLAEGENKLTFSGIAIYQPALFSSITKARLPNFTFITCSNRPAKSQCGTFQRHMARHRHAGTIANSG